VTYYRQCTVERTEFPAITTQITWIPEQFAVVGKYLKLHEEDGWRVKEVSSNRQPEDYVKSHERDHMGHRARTDV
jgi:hypothetical protein